MHLYDISSKVKIIDNCHVLECCESRRIVGMKHKKCVNEDNVNRCGSDAIKDTDSNGYCNINDADDIYSDMDIDEDEYCEGYDEEKTMRDMADSSDGVEDNSELEYGYEYDCSHDCEYGDTEHISDDRDRDRYSVSGVVFNDSVGFWIMPGMCVSIWMEREGLEKMLDDACIDYITAYDSNVNGAKETIMVIPEFGIELTMKEDKVNYMKSSLKKHSFLVHIDDGKDISDTILEIIARLKDKLGNNCDISIEKFNTESLNLVASFRQSINIGISKTPSGDVFIKTMRGI